MQTIIDAALPHLLELIGVALTGVITWAAARLRSKWGIDIEARHREALHAALMTGARLAIDRKLDLQAAVQLTIAHVTGSVPDAVARLQPSRAVLENLARAKLQEAAQVVGSDRLTEALRRAGAL